MPDAIFVLDVTPGVSAQRRGRRAAPADRIESRDADYHRRVRDGYLEAAAREPRAVVLDAGGAFDDLQRQLRERVNALVCRSRA